VGEHTRWQYRIVNLGAFFTGERLQSTLARLGAEGWELIAVYDKASNWIAAMEKGFALFKRPVAPDESAPPDGWAVLETTTSAGTRISGAPSEDDVAGWM
jgi:hypothetical protein